MATRSFIGKLNVDGSVSGVYCHWDGYPENNGKILQEHYLASDKVDELLALGSLSSLGPEIGEKHDFNDINEKFCKAYHRDRGDDLESNTVYSSVNEMVKNVHHDMGAEFAYVFMNGDWKTYTI